MKATDLLETQHRKVEALFKRIEGPCGDKEALVTELVDNLAAHMAMEEQVFYPAIREVKEDLVLESYEEHDVARYAMRNLLATSSEDETFEARVTTLKELIEHHVEEEEDELFPKVKKALAPEEQTALGAQMKEAFDTFLSKGFQALYGKAQAKPIGIVSNERPARKSARMKSTTPKTTPTNGKGKKIPSRSAHTH